MAILTTALTAVSRQTDMKPFAFVFPGQGSQSVGMLDAWGDHPAVIETLKEASDALGEDLARLIRVGPKEALALTTNTQPVMLVAAVAAYRVWMDETGIEPAAVAGHSLGEYSAMVAAGMLTLAQATPLVRFRAQAMQAAVPVGVGAMAAIAPTPTGTAACIACARYRTSGVACASVNMPAATMAEYSPSECPATAAGSMPVSDIQTR